MELKGMIPIAVMFVILLLTVSFGSQIMGDVKNDECPSTYTQDEGGCWVCGTGFTINTTGNNCYNASNASQTASWSELASSTVYNSSRTAQTAVSKIPSKSATIITVLLAALVVGILVKSFVFKK